MIGPPNMPQDFFTTFSLLCTVTLATEVSDAQVDVDWIHPNGTAFNSTNGIMALDSLDPMIQVVNGNAVYTHLLRFNTFQASQVGEYTCRANINESIIIRSFLVSIQGNTCIIKSPLFYLTFILLQFQLQWLYLVSIQLVVYLKALMSHYYVMSLLLHLMLNQLLT